MGCSVRILIRLFHCPHAGFSHGRFDTVPLSTPDDSGLVGDHSQPRFILSGSGEVDCRVDQEPVVTTTAHHRRSYQSPRP